MSFVGSTFGNIRIDARLAAGGMGEVYRGFDRKLERQVAVKTIRSEQRLSPTSKARFLREARLLSKLGHPGICQVHGLVETPEADLLVLELVPGRTLRAAAAEGLSHERLLRLAIQIAEALAAAHRERVVHRDLKAENIMVTPQGDIKILDFGVARLADDGSDEGVQASSSEAPAATGEASASTVATPTDSTPAGHPPSATPAWRAAFPEAEVATVAGLHEPPADDEVGSAAITRQGWLVGTVATMSPEQASGERVDEASDLYAFGILLQELFTGAAAYEPVPRPELLAKVRRAETRPIGGLDPDLTRLIQDLQSLDRRRRPDAGATAERLRSILDQPRRRRQRRWLMGGIATAFVVLVVVLAIVARLALVASHARGEAERRRKQAEDLLGFMVGDLYPKLQELGRLELLDAVGDRSIAYFRELPEHQLSAAELRHRVDSIAKIGEVRRAQGKLPEALVAFARAEELARAVVTTRPDDAAIRTTHLNTLEWLGQAYWDQGSMDRAASTWGDALASARLESSRQPESVELLFALARAEHNLGTVREQQGDVAEALRLYDDSVAHGRRVAAAQPENRDVRGLMAATLAFVSNARERQGDIEGALTTRREHVDLYTRLARGAPDDWQTRMDLANARAFLAVLLVPFGDPEEARQLFTAGLVPIAELAAQDPANTDLQRALGAFHSALGSLAVSRGDGPAALSELRQACDTFAGLVRQDDTNVDWRLQLGVCRSRQAEALAAGSPPRAPGADARELSREAVETLAPLLAGEPSDPVRGLIAQVMVRRGRLQAAAGDRAAARRSWEQALAALAPCAQPSTSWKVLAPWSEALLSLGRREEAAEAIARLQRMGFRDPQWQALAAPPPAR